MKNIVSEVYNENRKQLLAIGQDGYKKNGIGAVLFTVGDPRVIYAPARNLPDFMETWPQTLLDNAQESCATYDPTEQIVLVVFDDKKSLAQVTVGK